MAEVAKLDIDQEYFLTVMDIKEAASSFIPGKNSAEKMYCHHLTLMSDDNFKFKCQIVDINDSQNYCNVRDVILVRVTHFTRGIYTVKFIRSDKDLKTGALPTKEAAKQIANLNNPIVGGTAAAIALQSAVAYFAVVGSTNEAMDSDLVVSKTKEFHQLLIELHNQK